MELFKELLDYGKYLKENPFHQNLEIDVEDFFKLDKKIVRETYESVDLENEHSLFLQSWMT